MVTKSNLHYNTYTHHKGRIIIVFAFYLKLKGATLAVSGTHYFILYTVLSI